MCLWSTCCAANTIHGVHLGASLNHDYPSHSCQPKDASKLDLPTSRVGQEKCVPNAVALLRYQLLRPAPEYAPLMAPQQQLLDVCAAAFAIREEEPGTSNAECAREAVELNAEGVDAQVAAQLAATAQAKLAAIDKVTCLVIFAVCSCELALDSWAGFVSMTASCRTHRMAALLGQG